MSVCGHVLVKNRCVAELKIKAESEDWFYLSKGLGTREVGSRKEALSVCLSVCVHLDSLCELDSVTSV